VAPASAEDQLAETSARRAGVTAPVAPWAASSLSASSFARSAAFSRQRQLAVIWPAIALLLRWLYDSPVTRTAFEALGLHPKGTLGAGGLVGLGLVAAACGGAHPSGVASLGKTTTSSSAIIGGAVTTVPSAASIEKQYQEMLKFSGCMRSHGITKFPDPSSNGGMEVGSNDGIDLNSPPFRAAQEACQKYNPRPTLSKAQIAENQDRALAFAACMRKNGVPNFPDPQFGSNGAVIIRGQPQGVDLNSPTYQAASNKCNG
jgi:hypothetical protein